MQRKKSVFITKAEVGVLMELFSHAERIHDSYKELAGLIWHEDPEVVLLEAKAMAALEVMKAIRDIYAQKVEK